MYTTGCPNCRALKALLDEKNIPYSEVTSVEEMLSLGITKVPVLSVDGEMYDCGAAIRWANDTYKEASDEKQQEHC